MSVDFSNVKVGDRIKLTRHRDSTTELISTVGDTAESGEYVVLDVVVALPQDWDTLEILEKPLPTKYGAVLHNGYSCDSYLVLNSLGEWMDDSGWKHGPDSVRKFLRDGWKVVFEGLEYDA